MDILGIFIPKHTANLFKSIIVRTFCSDCMEYSMWYLITLVKFSEKSAPEGFIEHAIFEFQNSFHLTRSKHIVLVKSGFS